MRRCLRCHWILLSFFASDVILFQTRRSLLASAPRAKSGRLCSMSWPSALHQLQQLSRNTQKHHHSTSTTTTTTTTTTTATATTTTTPPAQPAQPPPPPPLPPPPHNHVLFQILHRNVRWPSPQSASCVFQRKHPRRRVSDPTLALTMLCCIELIFIIALLRARLLVE